MNTSKHALWALALLIGAAGCDSTTDPVTSGDGVQPADTPAVATLNEDLASVTKAAAYALGDLSTANWIHGEAMELFDGETNVLWATLNTDAEKAAGGALPWTSLLVQADPSVAGKSAGEAEAEIEAIIARVADELGGSVQLYWPNAEAWDGETAPLVGFTPVGVDLDLVTDIQGYDSDGAEVTITEAMAEARPVIIVTRNERTGPDGTVLQGESSASVTFGDDTAASASMLAGYFKLVNFRSNVDFEGWTQGSPEFRFMYARTGYTTATLEKEGPIYLDTWGKQIDQNRGRNTTLNLELFPWRADLYRSYKLFWYEADGGKENKPINLEGLFKVAGNLVGLPGDLTGEIGKFFSFTIDKEDDVIGNNMVHTDDAEPKYYSYGNVSYTLSLTPGGPPPAGTGNALVGNTLPNAGF